MRTTTNPTDREDADHALRCLDTNRTRPLLADAARQLRHPIIIVRETEETEELRREVAQLKALLQSREEKHQQELARRQRLEDATIRVGAPRYETGAETPVIALVGHKLASQKKAWWKLW